MHWELRGVRQRDRELEYIVVIRQIGGTISKYCVCIYIVDIYSFLFFLPTYFCFCKYFFLFSLGVYLNHMNAVNKQPCQQLSAVRGTKVKDLCIFIATSQA